MGMKDLLVHVNVSKHCRGRLEIAARLAKTFDARLTGLYTSAAGNVPFFMMEEIGTDVEPTMRAWWLRMRDEVKAEFDAFLRDTGVPTDWVEVDDDVAAAVPYHARYADLAIVGQIDPDELLRAPNMTYRKAWRSTAAGPCSSSLTPAGSRRWGREFSSPGTAARNPPAPSTTLLRFYGARRR